MPGPEDDQQTGCDLLLVRGHYDYPVEAVVGRLSAPLLVSHSGSKRELDESHWDAEAGHDGDR